MTPPANRRGGRGGGGGGNQGDGNRGGGREDSFAEVTTAILVGAFGEELARMIPAGKMDEFRKMVAGKQIGPAVSFLGGALAAIYGGNDIPREAILGATRGIVARLSTLPAGATPAELERALGEVDALKELKKMERAHFEPPKKLTFAEAFAGLSTERQKLIAELCSRFPKGEYHKLVYSALQLVGVADQLKALGAGAREVDGSLKQAVVDGFKSLFLPPPSPVKVLGKSGEEAIDTLRGLMAKVQTHTGTPIADHLKRAAKETSNVTPGDVLRGK